MEAWPNPAVTEMKRLRVAREWESVREIINSVRGVFPPDHWSINSKKQAAPVGLNVSVFVPLAVAGVLVTMDHAIGEVKLVVEYSAQPTVQDGQLMLNVSPDAGAKDNIGLGKNIPMGAEFGLAARLFTAATS